MRSAIKILLLVSAIVLPHPAVFGQSSKESAYLESPEKYDGKDISIRVRYVSRLRDDGDASLYEAYTADGSYVKVLVKKDQAENFVRRYGTSYISARPVRALYGTVRNYPNRSVFLEWKSS